MAPALKFLLQTQRTLLARIVCPSRRDVWLSVSLSVSLSIGACQGTRGSACTSFFTLPVYTSPTPPPTRDAP